MEISCFFTPNSFAFLSLELAAANVFSLISLFIWINSKSTITLSQHLDSPGVSFYWTFLLTLRLMTPANLLFCIFLRYSFLPSSELSSNATLANTIKLQHCSFWLTASIIEMYSKLAKKQRTFSSFILFYTSLLNFYQFLKNMAKLFSWFQTK